MNTNALRIEKVKRRSGDIRPIIIIYILNITFILLLKQYY